MLGKIEKPIIKRFANTLACILLSAFVLGIAKSQVVIVQSNQPPKARPPKVSSSKPRPKNRPKPTVASSPVSSPVSSPTPDSSLASAAESADAGKTSAIIPANLDSAVAQILGSTKAKPRRAADRFTSPTPKVQPASATNAEVANLAAPKSEMLTANPGKPKPIPAAVPLPKMFNFEFEVITTDDRGRIVGRRTQNATYYNESLNDGTLLDMVAIPGGIFLMGTQDSDVEGERKKYVGDLDQEIKSALLRRVQWEAPQHVVKMQPFYMSRFEVTQAQWKAVANLPRVSRDLFSDPSQFKGDNRPVEKVSWEDAVEFCERLSRATGRKYRLPSEAEWEYACRGGTNTPFNFGDAIKSDWANYQGKLTYSASPKSAFRGQTVAVGSLGVANGFGLYDMHGNVWEWCLDTWHETYASAPEDGKAWDKGGLMYLKILRGGSWDSSAGECRSNARNRMTSTIRLNNVGFRVVTEVTDQQALNQARVNLK